MMQRTPGEMLGFLAISVAMVVAAMLQLLAAPPPADPAPLAHAPVGSSRYPIIDAVVSLTPQPRGTPALRGTPASPCEAWP